MAKKHQTREHISVRKKKEEERKRAQRKAFLQKNKKKIIIGAVAAVVAIALIWMAVDYFYTPGGSMRMFMGKLLDVQENALIRNLGTARSPLYYTFGTIDAPEGYTLDPDYASGMTGYEQSFYYRADDENNVARAVYIAGVKGRTGEEMILTLQGTYDENVISEERTGVIAGHDVRYVYVVNQVADNEDDSVDVNLCIYVDTIQHSSVVLNLVSRKAADVSRAPTEEEMLAEAERIMKNLTVAH